MLLGNAKFPHSPETVLLCIMPNGVIPTTVAATRNRADSNVLIKSAKPTTSQAGNRDAYQFLRSLKEFARVPESELKSLADSSRFDTLSSGQYITIEGDEESLYGFLVVSGVLTMLKNSSNGKELIVELLQTGDVFGLLLMLAADKLPAQLSARSLQKSVVLWVPLKNFRCLLTAHPELLNEIVAHLLLCLHSSYNLSRGLAHDRVDVRIAAVLSSFALKFAKQTPSGEPYSVNFTRQQLANLTGTTPETAIRVTRAMQHYGLIDIKRPGIIRVLNLTALQELSET